MPRKLAPCSETSRGNAAKNALFGGTPFEVRGSGKRTAEQPNTGSLIGGIDAGDDRWAPASSIPVTEAGLRKTAKKIIAPASEGIGLEVASGPQYIVRKLKDQLAARGARGIVGLQRKFKIMDDDDSKSLDINEFRKALRESGLDLTDAELQMMFGFFDRDGSRSISFEEFIGAIRGQLNPKRKELVNMAFDVLDTDGSGFIELDDIISKYNASKHPDVLAGTRSTSDVLREFLDTFDVGGEKDGKVTKQEFENYYANISASIDDDVYFELMIRNAWHISGGEGQAANSTNRRVLVVNADGSETVREIKNDLGIGSKDKAAMASRLGVNANQIGLTAGGKDGIGEDKQPMAGARPIPNRFRGRSAGSRLGVTSFHNLPPPGMGDESAPPEPPTEFPATTIEGNLKMVQQKQADLVLDKLRAQLAERGARGIAGLQRKFKIIDDDGSKSLSHEEFRKAMRECSIQVSDVELNALFKVFDSDNNGSVSFDEFLVRIRGKLNDKRRHMVMMAFDVLDSDGSGMIELQDVVSKYNASKHPDVIAGTRSAGDVLREFLDTFDVGGEKDGKVTKQEFENYYANISASIDDDVYFELMIRNAWHISGGEGQAANSTNRRVLVVNADGSETVREIKNDLGIGPKDKAAMASRLGVNANQIGLNAGGKDGIGEDKHGKTATSAMPNRFRGGNKAEPAASLSFRSGKKRVEGAASTGTAFANSLTGDWSKSAPTGNAKLQSNGGFDIMANRRKLAEGKAVLASLRDTIFNQGLQGLSDLQKKFKFIDIDGSGCLSFNEFKTALVEASVRMSESDCRKLFAYFDTDNSESVSFEEFVSAVRGDLTGLRKEIVQEIFSMLDTNCAGQVEVQSIIGRFNASQHPDVVSRQRPQGDVMKEFIETFDAGYTADGYATEEEFINFYANLSAFVESDEEFEAIARHVWRDNKPGSRRGARPGSKLNRQVTYKSTFSNEKGPDEQQNNNKIASGFASKFRGAMTSNIDGPESEEYSEFHNDNHSTAATAAARAPITLPDGTQLRPRPLQMNSTTGGVALKPFNSKVRPVLAQTQPLLSSAAMDVKGSSGAVEELQQTRKDKEHIQAYKSRAMVAFSLKKYEEAEHLYQSAYNILENILNTTGEVSEKDNTISTDASRKLENNINECRMKRGLGKMDEEEDEVW